MNPAAISDHEISSLYLQQNRPPCFLRRNLTQILDRHQKRPLNPFRVTRESWTCKDIGPWIELNMDKLSPRLKISILKVAPSRSSPRRTNAPSRPDWIGVDVRRNGNLVDARCRINLSVLTADGTEVLFHDFRTAYLRGIRRDNGTFALDVVLRELEQPFFLRMDKLHTEIPHDDGTFHEDTAGEYKLKYDIKIDPRDVRGVQSALSLPTLPRGTLKAEWNGLPGRDQSASLLLVTDEHRTQHNLEIEMGWERPAELLGRKRKRKRWDTPMELHNQLRGLQTNLQLPTPAATPRSDRSLDLRAVAITYRFNTNTIKRQGYRCCFCETKDHETLRELTFHLRQLHSNLAFKHEAETENPGLYTEQNDEGEDENRVFISVERQIRIRQGVARGSEELATQKGDLLWRGPLSQRQIDKILRGGYFDWEEPERQEKVAKPTLPVALYPLRSHKEPAKVKRSLQTPAMGLMPMPQHPNHASGGCFFSAQAKTSLRSLTTMSMEHNDMSSDHLKLYRAGRLKESNLSNKERLFLEEWNNFVDHERIRADVFLGDCLLRFFHHKSAAMIDEDI